MTTILIAANVALLVGAIIGMLFIANRNKMGFVVFLFVEASMAYIGVATANYGLVLTAVVYLCMNIYSYVKWTKEGL